jgi:hypothetical protein
MVLSLISDRKGTAIRVIARILGVSALISGLGVGFGCILGGNFRDATGLALVLACPGAIIGAIAGAASEIVTAVRKDRRSEKILDW